MCVCVCVCVPESVCVCVCKVGWGGEFLTFHRPKALRES